MNIDYNIAALNRKAARAEIRSDLILMRTYGTNQETVTVADGDGVSVDVLAERNRGLFFECFDQLAEVMADPANTMVGRT